MLNRVRSTGFQRQAYRPTRWMKKASLCRLYKKMNDDYVKYRISPVAVLEVNSVLLIPRVLVADFMAHLITF